MDTKIFKECFVPTCKNNNKHKPQKLFLYAPSDYKRRKLWLDTINVNCSSKKKPGRRVLVCEDHFNLAEDAENWMYFKTMGTRLILKKHVVPHIFKTENEPEREMQISESEWRRKFEVLTKFHSKRVEKAVREVEPKGGDFEISVRCEPEFVAVAENGYARTKFVSEDFEPMAYVRLYSYTL